ncbi:MAG: glycosyltransferase [Pseudomonadales bacterium]|nr:glycosyltransferase [Pseudomonadales bacterium]
MPSTRLGVGLCKEKSINPRVTFVVSALGVGGAERVISKLVNDWVSRGCSVTLVSLRDDITDHFELDVRVQRVSATFFWPSNNAVSRFIDLFRRHFRLRKTILDSDPDIVVCFINKLNVRVLISLFGNSVPVIVSERSNPEQERLGYWWELLRGIAYRKAAVVVVQTTAVQAWFSKMFPSMDLAVVPNGVAPVNQAPFHDRTREVVSVGRLSWEKGQAALLESWARVDRGEWRLTIVGDGPDRERLEKLAQKLGVGDSVNFVGDIEAPDQILRTAGIFVLSSIYEGFPNALLEAMASGVPVVSFDCPNGPRDIVRDGVDGYLVPAGDTHQLSKKMQDLMNEESLRQQFGKNAMQVAERFSEKHVADLWYEVLRRSAV